LRVLEELIFASHVEWPLAEAMAEPVARILNRLRLKTVWAIDAVLLVALNCRASQRLCQRFAELVWGGVMLLQWMLSSTEKLRLGLQFLPPRAFSKTVASFRDDKVTGLCESLQAAPLSLKGLCIARVWVEAWFFLLQFALATLRVVILSANKVEFDSLGPLWATALLLFIFHLCL
jgi:hypothetical protein